WLKTFDSTTMKSSREVLDRLDSIIELAEKKLANSARDISGPGVTGTIAMLCESSGVGARVDLESIPKPSVKLEDWLSAYPGIGFIISTKQPADCLHVLRSHKLAAENIGEITEDRKIWLSYRRHHALFFDLNRESVFGVTRSKRS
ncbi:MAG: AIR synthase-related protein, partial [Candidatus Bathyarchaeota archaeon]|nr:AIR synthase-related protein [Candidatus Bathyarchaeota archaeon]